MTVPRRVPLAKPRPHGLSQRHDADPGVLSGDLGADEKMNHARSKQGAGLRGAGYHVSRQAAPELMAGRNRNGGRGFYRRQPWQNAGEMLCFFPPTAMGIRDSLISPSVVHFSISPTTCQGQAAKAVAAFAGVCRRNLRLRKSFARRSSFDYRKS